MQSHHKTHRHKTHRHKVLVAGLLSTTLAAGCFWDDPRGIATYVSEHIDRQSLISHLYVLESLASDTTDGQALTRAAGTVGYQNSRDYIVRTLEDYGYEVRLQGFDFRAWEELYGTRIKVGDKVLVNSKTASEGQTADYTVMSYSGDSNGFVNGDLVFITPDFRFDAADYDGTDGCEAADFEGKAVSGKIAVIQRGGFGRGGVSLNLEAELCWD